MKVIDTYRPNSPATPLSDLILRNLQSWESCGQLEATEHIASRTAEVVANLIETLADKGILRHDDVESIVRISYTPAPE